MGAFLQQEAAESTSRRRLVAATLDGRDRIGTVRHDSGWGWAVQTARPRDVGALLFVIGLFLSLFLVTLLVPVR
jgi:hypothetical protein